MAKILDMPKLSPTMEEGVLSAWHKKEGDPVAVDDLLAEVETDKATMEFRAFDKGTLLKLLVAPGAQVKLGQPVAILGEAGEDVSAMVAQAGKSGEGPPQATPAAAPAPRSAPQAKDSPAEAAPPKPAQPNATPPPGAPVAAADRVVETTPPPAQRRPPVTHVLDRTAYPAERGEAADAGSPARALASPRVRRAARDLGIDVARVQGTGPNGRLLLEDLDAARVATTQLARLAPAPAPAAARTDLEAPEARPLSPMRKTIARRLTESKQSVPHFYLTIDVDASRLVELRERINTELAAAGGDADKPGAAPAKVSLNDLLVKACALALVAVPECNASFSAEAILIHRRVDISVAVAIPDGLVTPVVRHADQKSVVAIAREVRELAARARSRKLKPEEMTDGTFSISNLGMFGIDEFSAVINPPEGAILAVGRVRDEPVVQDGVVVAGKRLAMTLSCDHRVVDGAVGAAFLAELRRLTEHPMRVLAG